MDYRLKWIGNRVISLLGLEEQQEHGQNLMLTLLETDNGSVQHELMKLLDQPVGENNPNTVFYAYTVYYDTIVQIEKEVTEWRIIPPAVTFDISHSKKKGKDKSKAKAKSAKKDEGPEPDTVLVEQIDDNVAPSEELPKIDADAQQTHSSEKVDMNETVIKDPSFLDVIPSEQILPSKPPTLDAETEGTIEYYTLKRFVPIMMKLPKLIGGFGKVENITFSSERSNVQVVYVLKLTEGIINNPIESLASQLGIGCCHSDMLPIILKECFLNLLHHTMDDNGDREKEIISNEVIESKSDEKSPRIEMHIPSMYHKISTIVQNKKIKARKKSFQNGMNMASIDSGISVDMEGEIETKPEIEDSRSNLKSNEIIKDLKKLTIDIKNNMEKSEPDLQLKPYDIPDAKDLNTIEQKCQEEPDLKQKLEELVDNWSVFVSSIYDQYSLKNFTGKTPMDEVNFWHEQSAKFNMLQEQLDVISTENIIKFTFQNNFKPAKQLKSLKEKLDFQIKIARDNIKFLSPLMDYFKVVTESSDLSKIKHSLDDLVDGLHSLWVLSTFYCTDEHIVPLIERIVYCLCSKIEVYLDVKHLFHKSDIEILELANEGNEMMIEWHSCYLKMRQQIEISGEGSRWEFDQRKLFRTTDYLATVCRDLAYIAEVSIEFRNILGAELKSIINEQNEVDNVIKMIRELVYPIETIDFSVYLPDNKENWDVIMNDFQKEVTNLENYAKTFIDRCFNNLRSSDEAMEMLIRFIKLKTRSAIHDQLVTKFNEVIIQFSKEVNSIKCLFEDHKTNPPLLKNNPNVSGSIFWCQLMRKKLTKSYNMFEEHYENIEMSKERETVFNIYHKLNRDMVSYETEKYNSWVSESLLISTSLMVQPVLFVKEIDRISSKNLLNKKKKVDISEYRLKNKLMIEYKMEFALNFKKKIIDIFEEAQIMENLGYELPISIREYTMKKEMLLVHVEALEEIILEYSNIIKQLTPEEKQLLRHFLSIMEIKLLPGLDRITWVSISLENYIRNCKKGLKYLNEIRLKLNTINSELKNKMNDLLSFDFFPMIRPMSKNFSTRHLQLYSCKNFFLEMEKVRTKKTLTMKETYLTITPLLMKIEFLTLHTRTGSAMQMSLFYEFWEMRLFECFVVFCTKNMNNFNQNLNGDRTIFEIEVSLLPPNIIMNPTPTDLHKLITSNVENFIQRLKMFVRWQRKSCIPYKNNDNSYEITFFEDIKKLPIIKYLFDLLEESAKKVTDYIFSFVQSWKKYDPLWSYDKRSTCRKFTENKNHIVSFNNKFDFYEEIIQDLNEQSKTVNIGCVRVNLKQLIQQIQQHALEWKTVLSQELTLNTVNRMNDLNSTIEKLNSNLNIKIVSVQDFKLIMYTIDLVEKMSVSVEISCRSIQNVFHILTAHSLKVESKHVKYAKELEIKWQDLYKSSLFRLNKLEKAKISFAEITFTEISQFKEDIGKFVTKFDTNGPTTVGNDMDKGLILLQDYMEELDALQIKRSKVIASERLLDTSELTDYSILDDLNKKKSMLCIIYDIYERFRNFVEEWAPVKLEAFEENKLKNILNSFSEELKCLPKEENEISCITTLQKKIDQFSKTSPLITSLQNVAVKKRHWTEIFQVTGVLNKKIKDLCLKDIFQMEFHKHEAFLDSIIHRANEELLIEYNLDNLEKSWNETTIQLIKYENYVILEPCDDLLDTLEHHSLNMQKTLISKYVGPFFYKVQNWIMKLTKLGELLELWSNVQCLWLDLKGVFEGNNNQLKSITTETNFNDINQMLQELFTSISLKKEIKAWCLENGCYDEFVLIKEKLTICKESLQKYFKEMRCTFHRFYFISDNEMLDIFGKPHFIGLQSNIKKMFNGIQSLNIEKDKVNIIKGLISEEGEMEQFLSDISTDCNIEVFMNQVVTEMKKANRQHVKEGIFYYGKEGFNKRDEWIISNLGRICLVSSSVWWTAEMEDVLDQLKRGKRNAMKDYFITQQLKLQAILDKLNENLSPVNILKLKMMAMLDTNARFITENFIYNNVTDKKDFLWERQLRFYWNKNEDNLFVHQSKYKFVYGYEFIGLNEKLVRTSMTERTYLAITNTLNLNLGSALIGVPNSGKTSLVKDLAQTLGILCIVTNCTAKTDLQSITSKLIGLCSTGCWGCFKGFNLINIDVLSVFSTYLYLVQLCLNKKLASFKIGNENIKCLESVGIFKTISGDYSDFKSLPSSVQNQFRPIACVNPEIEVICYVILFSNGFKNAKQLSKKLTTFYAIIKQLMNIQFNYEWGLRSLINILKTSIKLKEKQFNTNEDFIVVYALRTMNSSRLNGEDVQIFQSLIRDIFPYVEYRKNIDTNLYEITKQAAIKYGCIESKYQIEKAMQLNGVLENNSSVIVAGLSGSGKSTIINIYMESLKIHSIIPQIYTINPKAYTSNDFYGYVDEKNQWRDGLFSYLLRKINVSVIQNDYNFIILDGEIDPSWINALSTLLDSNKKLTLTNGEKINIIPKCYILFEVGNLKFACPSIISRANLVYVENSNRNVGLYWEKWITGKSITEKETLTNEYKRIIPSVLQYLEEKREFHTVIPQTKLNMVIQLCYNLDGLMQTEENIDKETLKCCFLVSIYYSFGALISENRRFEFDRHMKKLYSKNSFDDSMGNPANLEYLPTKYPVLFDYWLDVKSKCWKAWEWMIPKFIIDTNEIFSQEIIVPTEETIFMHTMIQQAIYIKRPILFVGNTGCSKTLSVKKFLSNLDSSYVTTEIGFSYFTSSSNIQNCINSKIVQRSKNIHGPIFGKTLLVFLDDISIPKMDDYGSQESIAYLRFMIEKQGYYDLLNDFKWKNIKDTFYIATICKYYKTELMDSRFFNLFSVHYIPPPKTETLKQIYTSILDAHFQMFPLNIQQINKDIIDMTVDLYNKILKEFMPTPKKFLYMFSMRDLSKLFIGICQSHPKFYTEPYHIIRLWRNEFCRIFSDKFCTYEDQITMQDCMTQIVTDYFGEDETTEMSESMNTTETSTVKEINLKDFVMRDPLLYGDFRNSLNENEIRCYEDLLDYDAVYYLFQEILEEYNRKNDKISVILFEDFLEHLTRISRVLRLPYGNLILIGNTCIGKRTLLKLAAFTSGMECWKTSQQNEYSENYFKNNIKNICHKIIEQKTPILLILDETEIQNEMILNIIYNILKNKSILDIFENHDEKSQLMNIFKPDREFSEISDKDWEEVSKLCSFYLHIVICCTNLDNLENWNKKWFGFTTHCTVNWIFPWPQQALLSSANMFYSEIGTISPVDKEYIAKQTVFIHESTERYCRRLTNTLNYKNYITPKHFYDFMLTHANLCDSINKNLSQKYEFVNGGISKILEANRELETLNFKINEHTVSIKNYEQLLEKLQKEILETGCDVDTKRQEMSEKTTNAEEQMKIIIKEKQEIEAALDIAIPILNAAKESLNELDKAEISEVRSFPTPPDAVQIVCECIVMLKGIKEISWKSCKIVLGEPNFVQNLQDMNFDLITQQQVRAIKAHMKSSKKMENMETVSRLAFGLFKFVNAVLNYCNVYKEIKPKREKVEYLENEYNNLEKYLMELKEDLTMLEEKLVNLSASCKDASDRKEFLQEDKIVMARRLEAAQKLFSGLGTEILNWQDKLKKLCDQRKCIPGDSQLCAAFLTYISAFPNQYRANLFNEWIQNIKQVNVLISEPFNIQNILSNETEIKSWRSHGLPSDKLSIQNAILITKSKHFSICIDPQNQANMWIQEIEKQNGIQVLTLSKSNFIENLKSAIQFGMPVIIENINQVIDKRIYHIIEKDIIENDGGKFVTFNDEIIKYNNQFRLYLTTPKQSIKLDPCLYAKAVVINWDVTLESVEKYLSDLIIKKEKIELQEQRYKLEDEVLTNKLECENLLASLFEQLHKTNINLLDDSDLIDTIVKVKNEINKIKEQSEILFTNLEENCTARKEYDSLASFGASIFVILCDQTKLNSLYIFSISKFISMFEEAINETPLTFENMMKRLILNVYDMISMSMLSKHKLIFSFRTAIRVMQLNHSISEEEIDFLVRKQIHTENPRHDCPFEWLSTEKWNHIIKLTENFPHIFGDLIHHINHDKNDWNEWITSDKLKTCELFEKYNDFQVLLLIKCLRPDNLYLAVRNFISKILGDYFVTPSITSVEKIYQKMTETFPALIIEFQDSDMVQEIKIEGEKQGISNDNIIIVSVGREEKEIHDVINECSSSGKWLIIQDCQIVDKFLEYLEEILIDLKGCHEKFRLWIITRFIESTIPVNLLQKTCFVVKEPLSEMQVKINETSSSLNINNANTVFKKLTHTLVFLHAVFLERQKFEKVGWNVCYNFQKSDFLLSFEVLKFYLENLSCNAEDIPWGALKFMMAEVLYGGRVTHPKDRLILTAYFNEYFDDFLFDKFQPISLLQNNLLECELFETATTTTLKDLIAPNTFGLCLSTEKLHYTEMGKRFVEEICKLYPSTETMSLSINNMEVVRNIIDNINNKLPKTFNIEKVKKRFEMHVTPCSTVLIQELNLYNKLIEKMKSSLDTLSEIIKGSKEMNPECEDIMECFLCNKLPNSWKKLAPPSRKPLSNWIDHFLHRAAQYLTWAYKEEPVVTWLSGLHNPKAYVLAQIQEASQFNLWPLDTVNYYTIITNYNDPDEVEQRPEMGRYINGLYIEGAQWDSKEGCLIACHSNIIETELPIMQIIPTQDRKQTEMTTISIPVYATKDRTNNEDEDCIFEADLPTKISNSIWILKGICLILNTD